MKIIFNKKTKNEITGKYYLKGSFYVIGKNLAQKYIDSGDAETYPPKMVAKKKMKMKFIKEEKIEGNGKI